MASSHRFWDAAEEVERRPRVPALGPRLAAGRGELFLRPAERRGFLVVARRGGPPCDLSPRGGRTPQHSPLWRRPHVGHGWSLILERPACWAGDWRGFFFFDWQ